MLSAAFMGGSALGWTGGVCGQKLIGHGWDLLSTKPEEVLDNAEAFDASGLDGVSIALRGSAPNDRSRTYAFSDIATDKPWFREMFTKRIDTLRRLKDHKGLRESLIVFFVSPSKHIDWRDDAAWERFAGNVGVLAWVGRESGLRGYMIDSEDYSKQRQYFYNPDRDGVTYDEACRLARKRGGQVFRALFSEHKDAVLLSFWFFSEAEMHYAASRDPLKAAEKRKDLWPSFVNGILDVLPQGAKFVDGNEHAYLSDYSNNDFYVKAFNQRQGLLGLVARENRAKYQAALSVGLGLYLDCYLPENKPGQAYYFGPAEDGSRLTHFKRNLEQAVRVSSEYVWIYGEKRCWVEWKNTPKSNLWKMKRYSDMLKSPAPTWEKSLPGLASVLTAAK